MPEGTASAGRNGLRNRVLGDDGRNDLRLAAAAALVLLLVPLLPFLLIVWMISRTLEGVRDEVSWE